MYRLGLPYECKYNNHHFGRNRIVSLCTNTKGPWVIRHRHHLTKAINKLSWFEQNNISQRIHGQFYNVLQFCWRSLCLNQHTLFRRSTKNSLCLSAYVLIYLHVLYGQIFAVRAPVYSTNNNHNKATNCKHNCKNSLLCKIVCIEIHFNFPISDNRD